MNPRDWPIGGAAIALVIGIAIGLAVAWHHMPSPPVVAQPAPPAAPEIAFSAGRAFGEFHARSLGLPVVQTFQLPHKDLGQK